MVHIDTKKLDAGLVAATPQPTGFAYYQNDRNAYEVVLTLGNLEQSLEGCNAYVIWTYEDGSTTMQEAVVEPPQTIRHVLSPALLAKAGQVVCTLVVYNEAASYRRTLGQWLCQVLPEAQEPTVPPEDPDIPIIQSLLLDAQRLNRETIAALGRAEEVEQGTEHARAAAQAAQAAAETAQTGALASQTAAEAARDAAATQAATAEGQAAAAAQSAARASDSATAAQVAKAGAEVAQTGAQTAQLAAEDARDEMEAALGSRVPNTRTINGKTLDADVVLTAGDVGAVAEGKSTKFPLPLNNGYVEVAENRSYYMKNAFDEVTVRFTVKKVDDSAFVGAYIASLPVGFRPAYPVDGVMTGTSEGTNRTPGLVEVETDGRLAVYPVDHAGVKTITGFVSFLAEER